MRLEWLNTKNFGSIDRLLPAGAGGVTPDEFNDPVEQATIEAN